MAQSSSDRPSSSSSSSTPDDGLVLDLDSIFVGRDFRAESFSQPRWWASGSCYTALVKAGSQKSGSESSPGCCAPGGGGGGGDNGSAKSNGEEEKASSSGGGGGGNGAPTPRDLVWHDVAANTTKTYVSSDLLIPPGHDAPLAVDDYALSPDKSRLLIFTNSRKVWRKKTRGDYWVLDITARDLRQLGGWTAKPSSLMFATFSPCGNKVAYVMGNNLYVQGEKREGRRSSAEWESMEGGKHPISRSFSSDVVFLFSSTICLIVVFVPSRHVNLKFTKNAHQMCTPSKSRR